MVDKFVSYHSRNGGVSRYKKFRYYFKNLHVVSDPNFKIETALLRFPSTVKDGLIKCNYLDCVLRYILKLKKKEKSLFIVSGSDEEELIEIFKERKIFIYIDKVFGSPADKETNTQKVIDIVGSKRKSAHCGDSKSDYLTSRKFNMDFVKGVSWVEGETVVM